MKKIVTFVMLIIATLTCAFTFAACGDTDVTAATNATLVMNKRYIIENDVSEDAKDQCYFVFHANGTGEYAYHYDYDYDYYDSHTHEHYIIHFKYTYVDGDKSAVVCFYDSIERLDGDDGSYTKTTWSTLVTVSKNVLTTVGTSYTFWINEDYLKTIPNLGK